MLNNRTGAPGGGPAPPPPGGDLPGGLPPGRSVPSLLSRSPVPAPSPVQATHPESQLPYPRKTEMPPAPGLPWGLSPLPQRLPQSTGQARPGGTAGTSTSNGQGQRPQCPHGTGRATDPAVCQPGFEFCALVTHTKQSNRNTCHAGEGDVCVHYGHTTEASGPGIQ